MTLYMALRAVYGRGGGGGMTPPQHPTGTMVIRLDQMYVGLGPLIIKLCLNNPYNTEVCTKPNSSNCLLFSKQLLLFAFV